MLAFRKCRWRDRFVVPLGSFLGEIDLGVEEAVELDNLDLLKWRITLSKRMNSMCPVCASAALVEQIFQTISHVSTTCKKRPHVFHVKLEYASNVVVPNVDVFESEHGRHQLDHKTRVTSRTVRRRYGVDLTSYRSCLLRLSSASSPLDP